MKNRQLALTLGLFITGSFILFSSCKKINESTELGGDLIPPIDNINTFDTSLTVEAYNGLFSINAVDPLAQDSTRSIYTDEQFLGMISNDPLFGTTDAKMYFQLNPSYYPYTFGNRPDSLTLDSVVLVLDHLEVYGDSVLTNQTVNVYEIDSTASFRTDTGYLMRADPNLPHFQLLGSKTFLPKTLDDSVKVPKDTTINQLRIRLSDAFGKRLLNTYDTTTSGGRINAYSGDSAFKSHFRGFALESAAGNAVMGFDLTGVNTKLAIYYRDDNGGNPKKDTLVSYFTFNIANSASVNWVERGYGGFPIQAAQGGTTSDASVYLQSTPGSFAKLKIPALTSFNNSIIHRAELIAEEQYDPSDLTFPSPNILFLDAYNPSISKYMMVPYDLVPDIQGSFNFTGFGVIPYRGQDGAGNPIKVWRYTMTRYVQHVVNKTDSAYDLRLWAPLRTVTYYRTPVPGSTPSALAIDFSQSGSSPVKGRVRIVGNTGPLDSNPHRLRLRVVYSKL